MHLPALPSLLLLTLFAFAHPLQPPRPALPALSLPRRSAAVRTTCPYGSHWASANDCKPCPHGTYQTDRNRWVCTPCPRNTYSFGTGVQHASLCRPCPPHTLSLPGSSSCTACPPGHVRSRRGDRCVRCEAGSHLAWSWAGCRKCEFKTYTSRPNRLFCIPCPVYQKPNASRTGCIPAPCPHGSRMLYENGKCVPCHFHALPGSGKQSLCGYCPDRMYAPANSSQCQLCRPGMFVDTYAHKRAFQSGSPGCKECPSGTTTKGSGKPMCTDLSPASSTGDNKAKPKCPEGTFLDKDGDCNACLRDEYRDVALNTCVLCPANQYSFGGVVESCMPCLPGQQLTDEYSVPRCQCARGTVVDAEKRVCVPCPAGTYHRAGTHRCEQCPPYRQASKAGMTSCVACPAKTSSVSTNGRLCTKMSSCGRGYIRVRAHDGCVSVRTGCPAGYTRKGYGADNKLLCTSATGAVWCPKGLTFNLRDGCISCDAGSRLVTTDKKVKVCRACKNGVTTGKESERRCEKCPRGYFARGNDCICPRGSYINEARGCVACPTGQYILPFSDCHGESYSTYFFP